MEALSPSERVVARLTPLLGPNTARNALRTFCGRTLGKEPADLAAADVPALAAALRPALRTLLGAGAANRVVAEILEDFR